MTPADFPLGMITATNGALAALAQAREDPFTFLDRHQHGDWGELAEEDRQENARAVLTYSRILSAYTLTTGVTLLIMTEADRSVTTLVLLEEA